ncbi:MAG: hypothetical protein S4CHLAM7_07500 [Chlamydiae bacterium]|nr:hypothetical protein [Chlamydiota bacterium]
MKSSRSFFLRAEMFLLVFVFIFASCTSGQVVGTTAKAPNSANDSNWQSEINELNEKITILTRWQQGYRMTAQQAQFRADRIQFQEDNIVDAKRLWKVAENAKQKAEDLQVIIDGLVQQRNGILTRHNQPIPKNTRLENKNSIEQQE